MDNICTVETCTSPSVNSRGWCNAHYQRWRQHGDVRASTPIGKIVKGGKKYPPKQKRTDNSGQCSIDNCQRQAFCRGWCQRHYYKWRHHGDPEAELKQWKGKRGGKYIKEGYVYVYEPNHPQSSKRGHVFEHRLVMSGHLGRYLNDDEIVHHKNGITTDNRIENLELRAAFHGKGQDIPDLLEWAYEIIDRYGPKE